MKECLIFFDRRVFYLYFIINLKFNRIEINYYSILIESLISCLCKCKYDTRISIKIFHPLHFSIQYDYIYSKKIVQQQVLRGCCKEKASISKFIIDKIMKKIFQHFYLLRNFITFSREHRLHDASSFKMKPNLLL